MKRIIGKSVVLGILLSSFACAIVWAQSTAQISGTVKDQSGAVLPGVQVTATQTATGLERSIVTNETGSYVLTNLPVGPYKLEASLPGFHAFAQTGIVLQVGSNPVINIGLEVGQVSETVKVEADAALVETRSTGIGQVIDNVRVMELPLAARNVQQLIILSGASVGGGAQNSPRNYPTDIISVAGGLPNGLTYLLDGGTHNDPYGNLNLPLPFPDALQEFKVETSSVPAQYGQHSGGAVNVVTKSGTNYIHSMTNWLAGRAAPGNFTFSATNTGLSMGDFMLGKPSRFSEGQLIGYYLRRNYAGSYLQDTWKTTSRLTVNSGLRWEPYVPPYDEYGQSGFFNPKAFEQGIRSTVFKNAPAGLLFAG